MSSQVRASRRRLSKGLDRPHNPPVVVSSPTRPTSANTLRSSVTWQLSIREGMETHHVEYLPSAPRPCGTTTEASPAARPPTATATSFAACLLSNWSSAVLSLATTSIATEGVLRGVSGFIATVQRTNSLREFHDDRRYAVLYGATIPGGTVRFAEFFTYRDGVIDTLFLQYDGPDYIDRRRSLTAAPRRLLSSRQRVSGRRTTRRSQP